MKYWSLSILIMCLSLWAMLSSSYAGTIDLEDIPESIFIDQMKELYEGVVFDHVTHADCFGCGSCHHHTTGASSLNDSCTPCHAESSAADDVSCSACHKENTAFLSLPVGETVTVYHIDKPGLKGALHLQCLGCHQSEGGPTGCQECHVFTTAGQKRFALEDSPGKN